MWLGAINVQAQIVIGGNVYGGARQANVGGSAFLHIDGEHASSYVVIDKAYGGNDIAGTIGDPENPAEIPTELTEVGTEPGKNNIDNTWNAFVRISTKTVTTGTGDDAVTTEAPGAQ